MSKDTRLIVKTTFENNGVIPKRNSGLGENYSPQFKLENISPDAESIAIILDDLDIPFTKRFNHWTIWNLPVMNIIPENIPNGEILVQLGNAQQGIGYGKHMYMGPKPPFFVRKPHRYEYHVYVLDSRLKLSSKSKKDILLAAMSGHIVQEAVITGLFGIKLI